MIKTTKARIYRDMYEELRFKFPGVNMADLLKVAYNTSALKIEARLRPHAKRNIKF